MSSSQTTWHAHTERLNNVLGYKGNNLKLIYIYI